MAAGIVQIAFGACIVLGILLMAAALASKAFDLGVKLRGRAKRPECAECGYVVEGLGGSRCPECGADLRVVGVVEPGAERPVRSVRVWTMAVLAAPAAVASVMLPPIVGILPGVRKWEVSETYSLLSPKGEFQQAEIVATWRGSHSFSGNHPAVIVMRRDATPASVVVTVRGSMGVAELVIDHRAGAFRFEGSGLPEDGQLPVNAEHLERLWSAAGEGPGASSPDLRTALESLATALNSPNVPMPSEAAGAQHARWWRGADRGRNFTPAWVTPLVLACIWAAWGLLAWGQYRQWRSQLAASIASRLRTGETAEPGGPSTRG